jgi:uncharacterized protein YecE (DUF72 family)
MAHNADLIEFVLPASGEIVYARTHREAREKLARFGYSREELQAVATAVEYEAGSYLRHNGRFWA